MSCTLQNRVDIHSTLQIPADATCSTSAEAGDNSWTGSYKSQPCIVEIGRMTKRASRDEIYENESESVRKLGNPCVFKNEPELWV